MISLVSNKGLNTTTNESQATFKTVKGQNVTYYTNTRLTKSDTDALKNEEFDSIIFLSKIDFSGSNNFGIFKDVKVKKIFFTKNFDLSNECFQNNNILTDIFFNIDETKVNMFKPNIYSTTDIGVFEQDYNYKEKFSIGDNCFDGCTNLTSITIYNPNTLLNNIYNYDTKSVSNLKYCFRTNSSGVPINPKLNIYVCVNDVNTIYDINPYWAEVSTNINIIRPANYLKIKFINTSDNTNYYYLDNVLDNYISYGKYDGNSYNINCSYNNLFVDSSGIYTYEESGPKIIRYGRIDYGATPDSIDVDRYYITAANGEERLSKDNKISLGKFEYINNITKYKNVQTVTTLDKITGNLNKTEYIQTLNLKQLTALNKQNYKLHMNASGMVLNKLLEITFPEHIENIPYGFLNNQTSLTSVNFLSNTTNVFKFKILDSIFKGCSNLTLNSIPTSVNKLGDNCFMNCLGLTSIPSNSYITEIGNYCFSKCSNITQITLEKISHIGDYAFKDCSKLTSITLNGPLTSIGIGAFFGCTSLTSIIFNTSGVINIGSYCFKNCSLLNNNILNSLLAKITTLNEGLFEGCTKFENCTNFSPLFDGKFGNFCFKDCTNLRKIKTNNIIDIGSYCFKNCNNLTYLGTNDTLNNRVDIINSVTKIGRGCFDGCNKIENVYILNSDNYGLANGTHIFPKHLFRGCSNLRTIHTKIFNPSDISSNNDITSENILPSGIQIIDEFCFANCENLSFFTIGPTIQAINEGAFYNCINLTSCTFDNNVLINNISSYTFYGCNKLSSINLPSSLRYINNFGFSGCYNMDQITIPSSIVGLGLWCLSSATPKELNTLNPIIDSTYNTSYVSKLQNIIIEDPTNLYGCSLSLNNNTNIFAGSYGSNNIPIVFYNLITDYTNSNSSGILYVTKSDYKLYNSSGILLLTESGDLFNTTTAFNTNASGILFNSSGIMYKNILGFLYDLNDNLIKDPSGNLFDSSNNKINIIDKMQIEAFNTNASGILYNSSGIMYKNKFGFLNDSNNNLIKDPSGNLFDSQVRKISLSTTTNFLLDISNNILKNSNDIAYTYSTKTTNVIKNPGHLDINGVILKDANNNNYNVTYEFINEESLWPFDSSGILTINASGYENFKIYKNKQPTIEFRQLKSMNNLKNINDQLLYNYTFNTYGNWFNYKFDT